MSRRSYFLSLGVLLLATACEGKLTSDDPGADDPVVDGGQAGELDGSTTPRFDAGPLPVGETLTVAFDTTANGGPYAPKNVVAVWIERPDGTFVKTIGRWAMSRIDHLVAWTDKSGQDMDAVSGASRLNHTERLTVSWTFGDNNGQKVADGSYVIRMELADSNANQAAQNRQGTFTFAKDGVAATETGLTNAGFNNVTITYSGR
jgi:hypothetical protein